MTETKRIEQKYGKNTIKHHWYKGGMYAAAERLQTSPFVIRYIANKNNWQRPIDLVPHLKKAVQSGNVPNGFYKNLKSREEITDEIEEL